MDPNKPVQTGPTMGPGFTAPPKAQETQKTTPSSTRYSAEYPAGTVPTQINEATEGKMGRLERALTTLKDIKSRFSDSLSKFSALLQRGTAKISDFVKPRFHKTESSPEFTHQMQADPTLFAQFINIAKPDAKTICEDYDKKFEELPRGNTEAKKALCEAFVKDKNLTESQKADYIIAACKHERGSGPTPPDNYLRGNVKAGMLLAAFIHNCSNNAVVSRCRSGQVQTPAQMLNQIAEGLTATLTPDHRRVLSSIAELAGPKMAAQALSVRVTLWAGIGMSVDDPKYKSLMQLGQSSQRLLTDAGREAAKADPEQSAAIEKFDSLFRSEKFNIPERGTAAERNFEALEQQPQLMALFYAECEKQHQTENVDFLKSLKEGTELLNSTPPDPAKLTAFLEQLERDVDFDSGINLSGDLKQNVTELLLNFDPVRDKQELVDLIGLMRQEIIGSLAMDIDTFLNKYR